MGNAPSSPLLDCVKAVEGLPSSAISTPSDPFFQWNAVKPYNTAVKVNPAGVVRPSTAEQVSGVVKCAADHGVKVQAKSGGHSYANYGLGGEDGAIVVDMVNFQQFSMDDATGDATIGSGTLLGDVTKRLHDAGGRAMAHGTCPQVGIGGHATIGGLGPISRLWGSALDHVIETEVVLANGTITRASEQTNPDIFFALKGAAASFGVITEFKVKTHPEPAEVTRYTYTLTFGPKKNMANTFAAWQQLVAKKDLTWKLASQVIVFELGMVIQGTYFGPEEEFKALKFDEQLAANATTKSIVLDDWLGAASNWAESEAIKLVGGASGPFYSKSLTFKEDTLIPFEGIQSLFNYFDDANKGTLIWFAIFDLEGGAINSISTDATAYAHRDTLFYIQTYAFGIGSLPQASYDFLEGINKVIADHMPGVDFGAYAGYVDPKLENGQEKYWGSNLPRLQQIKSSIDPNDVFHNPQSVRPA